MKDDAQLINKVLNGDKNAFDQLTEKYYAACVSRARRLVNDRELAEDLVQSAFIQAYFCLSNLKDKSRFRAWLVGIIKNEAKSYLRKTQRTYASLENYCDYLRTYDENSGMQCVAEIVLASIRALPDAYRHVVQGFYYEDRSIKELAEVSGLSIETVKVRLHRGRKMLQASLQRYPELYQYYQHLKHKQTMKQVHIADVIMGGTNQAYCAILLRDEENTSAFQIIIRTQEATAIVMALKNIDPPRPFVFNVVVNIMQTNRLKMDRILIHDLVDGVFISTIKLRNGKKEQTFDARPSDAITLALMLNTPIYVSQKVLDQAGFPIPEKYRNTLPTEKGMALFAETMEDWDRRTASDLQKAKTKTVPEVRQSIDRIIEFTFGDSSMEKHYNSPNKNLK